METLELIAGGNKTQTEEMWNFFMTHGKADFLKPYENDHAAGILAALKSQSRNLFRMTKRIENAKSESSGNMYKVGPLRVDHETMMGWLQAEYAGVFDGSL